MLPTELGRKITQSDISTIRSTHQSSLLHPPQSGHTISIRNNHTLHLSIILRHSLIATETAQSFTTTRRLVRNHTTNGTLEDLSRRTLMTMTTSRVGVHRLTHESLTTDRVTHHYTFNTSSTHSTVSSDVQLLTTHTHHLLAAKQLLGNNGGQTTHNVATTINDNFLFEHFYIQC